MSILDPWESIIGPRGVDIGPLRVDFLLFESILGLWELIFGPLGVDFGPLKENLGPL